MTGKDVKDLAAGLFWSFSSFITGTVIGLFIIALIIR